MIHRDEWNRCAEVAHGALSPTVARMALDHLRLRHEAEVARLRGLVERALPLVAHAVDVPSRELEAEEWLAEARRPV